MMPVQILITSFIIIIMSACNSNNQALDTEGRKSLSDTLRKDLLFVPYEVKDTSVTGLIVFNYLIPELWQIQDQLTWDRSDTMNPIRYQAKLYDSSSGYFIQIYQERNFSYSVSPKGIQGSPLPASILDELKKLISEERHTIPYKIKSENTYSIHVHPQYLDNDTATDPYFTRAIITIEFLLDNKMYEEEFYANMEVRKSSTQSFIRAHSATWSVYDVFSCRTPKGKLKDGKGIALTVTASKTPTLDYYRFLTEWKNKASIVSEDTLEATIHNIVDKIQDESISSEILLQYKENLFLQKYRFIRDTMYLNELDQYNEDSITLELLPEGFAKAWISERRDVLLTNESAFDPNNYSSRSWKLLQKSN